jgi:glycerol transport system ATP-binding protein
MQSESKRAKANRYEGFHGLETNIRRTESSSKHDVPVALPGGRGDSMELMLEGIAKRWGAATHLYPLDLALVPRAVTVLLGATQAGKTSLMRVMAGLDAPSAGRLLADGRDVTGVPVRERQVAMVYQQFINYPSMTVADNIASPLRLQGTLSRAAIDAKVAELAARLHIEPFLQRLPAELSGGQQQRVALARALAKKAPLMLLDEPLVNLDYKLREELRDELSALFASGESTVVYATTEPTEALLLGGHTAVLDAGELLQYGPTAEVFHRPRSIRVARAFSDPPMNLVQATRAPDGSIRLPAGLTLALPWSGPPAAEPGLTVGIRAPALRVHPRPGDLALPGTVELAEISGSDTFVHVDTVIGELVAQMAGVHEFTLGAPITLHLSPLQVHLFDAGGELLVAPMDHPALN